MSGHDAFLLKTLNDFPFHLDPKLVYPIQSGLKPPWPYSNIVFFPHSTTSLWHSQPGLVQSSPPFLPPPGNFFPRSPHCVCLGIFSTWLSRSKSFISFLICYLVRSFLTLPVKLSTVLSVHPTLYLSYFYSIAYITFSYIPSLTLFTVHIPTSRM